jgi:predicted GTPase
VINKVDSAPLKKVEEVRKTISLRNPNAAILLAESAIKIENPEQIKGKKVLVVEDGPTVTHGEMRFGAGILTAERYGAAVIVDPRPYLSGTLKKTFTAYPQIGPLLPAMGYSTDQVNDLETTINNAECDLVLMATPIDLTRLIHIQKPILRVRYEYKDHGKPTLSDVLAEQLKSN